MTDAHGPAAPADDGRNTWGRRLAGAALLALAVVAGFAAAPIAFVAGAVMTAAIPVLVAAGLSASLIVAGLLAWGGCRRLGWPRPVRASLATAAAVAIVVTGVAGATIFRPLPSYEAEATPANVKFWDLPTGSRLAYVAIPGSGERRNAPVIFLHGGPGTPGEGMPPGGAELAAEGFDVYAYDQLGAGRSTRLADVTGYTVARHVADLEAIREELHANQLILVGRSWGATLAAAYLAAHPDRVATVVFVSPGAIWGGAFPDDAIGSPSDRLTPDQVREFGALVTQPRMLAQAALQAVNPNAAHALVGDDEADAFMRRVMLLEKDAAACPGAAPVATHENRPGFYVNQVTAADARTVPDPRPRLRSLETPALIMRGDCDFLKWAVADAYRQTLSNATLVCIEGAGHGIASERPDVYVATLRAFLLDRPLPLPDCADPPTSR